ncbi:MAG: hypothetical protein ACYTGO_18575 [Planctomycetota bacterium]
MESAHRCARLALPGTLAAVLLAGATLVAQEQPDPQQIDASVLLSKAIKKMASLNSIRFKTTEAQDAASTRQIMKQMAGIGGGMLPGAEDKVVRGALSDGVLHARMNDGEDEAVFYRGRTVARSDSAWKLRRNRLYGGARMAFVLDPQLFFEALGQLPKSALKLRKIDHQDTTKGKRVVLSITLKGEAADDFALAGTLPAIAEGFGGMIAKLGAMGGGGGGRPDLTVDLAIVIDPSTALVHRVRTASYQEGGMGGPGRVVIGAPGGFGEEKDEEEEEEEDEEEEVRTRDAQGNRLYKRGLPVRKLLDSLSKMQFNISFTKHGQPYVFELDAAGRKLLRLPASK